MTDTALKISGFPPETLEMLAKLDQHFAEGMKLTKEYGDRAIQTPRMGGG